MSRESVNTFAITHDVYTNGEDVLSRAGFPSSERVPCSVTTKLGITAIPIAKEQQNSVFSLASLEFSFLLFLI